MNIIFKTVMLMSLGLLSAQAFTDSDFDGIRDALDQCPKSSMEDIVDETGCVSKYEFSLGLGQSMSNGTYGGTDDIATYNTNMILAVKKKQWYLSSAFSYYSSGPSDPTVTTVSGSSGLGDTYITAGYTDTFGKQSQWSIGLLGNLKLATADTTIGTGESDYGIGVSASYTKKELSYLASVGYTLTGDSDAVVYNNIKNFSIGTGYMISSKFYTSVGYNYADAYIDGTDATQTLSLFGSLAINRQWNASLSYSRGLSDSAATNATTLMLTRKLN